MGVGLDFGEAIRNVKAGARIARAGWNGKGMYVYIVEHDPTTRIRSYLMMKTAQEDLVPWLASQSDVLAEDWEVV